jgi:hypothetical protein
MLKTMSYSASGKLAIIAAEPPPPPPGVHANITAASALKAIMVVRIFALILYPPIMDNQIGSES